jgi:hypothetical protein
VKNNFRRSQIVNNTALRPARNAILASTSAAWLLNHFTSLKSFNGA